MSTTLRLPDLARPVGCVRDLVSDRLWQMDLAVDGP